MTVIKTATDGCYRLPHPSIRSPVPPGGPVVRALTRTASDWVAATGRGASRVLTSPELVERQPVSGVDSRVRSALGQACRFVAPAAEVVELPNAWVWGTEGTVITEDGCLVADLGRVAGRSIEDHPAWAMRYVEHQDLGGTVAVVAVRAAAHNFSHFFADTLPRIELIRESGISVDTWLFSGVSHRWQREAIDMMGIQPDSVVSLNEQPLVRAERLVVPSRSGFAPFTAPWARRLLRRTFAGESAKRDRRLVISRANSVWRKLINEQQMADVLAGYGFELVVMEAMSFARQLAVMAEADVVVAPHGAALAHLLNAPAGGTVIEIAHPKAIHSEYYGIASLAGWTHRLVVSSGLSDQGEPETILGNLWYDPQLVVHELINARVPL